MGVWCGGHRDGKGICIILIASGTLIGLGASCGGHFKGQLGTHRQGSGSSWRMELYYEVGNSRETKTHRLYLSIYVCINIRQESNPY